jgi:hypothetical protein
MIKTPGIPPDVVIFAGASNLPMLAQSPRMFLLLREVYVNAVRHVFIYALAAGCIGFVFTLRFKNLNVKTVARDRKAAVDLTSGIDKAKQPPPVERVEDLAA